METTCPNCCINSDLVTIGNVDYIHCPECGWFETQSDGSMRTCDPPEMPQEKNQTPPDNQDDLASQEPADQLPADDDKAVKSSIDPPVIIEDQDDDDEDSVTVKINFED